jgi:putative NADH-flavin reductase
MVYVLHELRKLTHERRPRRVITMKLTIFGATGGSGTCLVEQAVAAGHEVTAVVRDPARLAVPAPLLVPGRQRLRIVTADIMDPAAITPAVADADAVLSAIGPRGTGPSTVSEDSARSIIAAMRKSGVRRLLTVSGSIVTDAGEGPFMRYLLKPLARRTALRHVCADMRRAEEEIRASHLDWTIMRPPRLTGRAASGTYRTAIDRNLPRGLTVSRADVAACMLTLLDDPATVHRHVGIAD